MRIRLRRYICVLCCLLLLLRQTPGLAQEPEPGELYAQAAVLMDADSGRVLYDKNGAQVLAMASTTKIMTCILALELADPQETVEISAYAASMPKVKLYVQKGERYLLEDLLYSLMLESHNDAAVAIAEHLGRKYLPEQLGEKSPSEYSPEESRQAVEAFAAVMNRKAAELGCGDTWFITPNGLDATQVLTLENGETVEKRHSTTARDLASIMCYCIRRSPRSQAFLEITQTPSHSFSIDNGRSFSCANHNAFLQMMQGAISGKTGFTNQAGYCYVGALERDGRTLVVALLACGWPNNKGYKWSDTRILMNFGLNDFAYHSLDEVAYDESELESLPVLGGQTLEIGDTAYAPVRILERGPGGDYQGTGADGEDQEIEGLLLRDGEEIRVECHMERQLQAPVEAGKQVGTIQYIFQDQVYREEHIVTTRAVREIDYRWCFQQIMRYFLL
ncbi:D-alanyl-D-alanine carboxypeptidase DacB [Lachnospiraceae bacterium]|nr:D-alanyl-D-alanine carboxypeptidase DacB [Lachnospiraceae bacterium]